MSTKDLEINAGLIMQQPAEVVFEAIVDPEIMKNYFIEKGSGRMDDGKTLIWKFPEFDFEFPIQVRKVVKDKFISYTWADPQRGETTVEITLTPKEKHRTFVTVLEKSMPNNEAGIKWLKSNTEGWANFLACMKAWLDHGVHLREGAFDPSQMPT